MVRQISRGSLSSVYYGWWVVLACSGITFLSSGIFFYGFTALLKPVVAEFGWSRAVISLAFSFGSLESGVMAPVVGMFVDRLGARRMMRFGVVVFGLGLLVLSRIGSLWAFYASFVLISIGIGSCVGIPCTTVVVNWFTARRSAALGVLMAGAGAGGILVPLFAWLITSYGWRTALVIAGACVWAIGIPLARLVKDRPRNRNAVEPAAAMSRSLNESNAASFAEMPVAPNCKLGEALGSRAFWMISIAVTLSGMGISGISVHLIPYADSVGFSAQVGAFMVVVLTLCSIAGRLGLSWLGDLWDKRYVLGLALALEVASLVTLISVPRLGVLVVALAVFGIAFGGTVPLRPAILAEYFGLRAFGKIQGVINAVMTIGGIAGPVLMGWVFDRTGSYRLALAVFAAAALAAVPLVLRLPRPARHPRHQVVSLR
ncbi:MAG: MFS transporter [Chloroflexi bacterium]|nr:MFS transporter [Chloroflexota bacterium]